MEDVSITNQLVILAYYDSEPLAKSLKEGHSHDITIFLVDLHDIAISHLGL